jgi:hypothetical protein
MKRGKELQVLPIIEKEKKRVSATFANYGEIKARSFSFLKLWERGNR